MQLASIIITNYNYSAYLRQCIDSALAQTHLFREVIVVDDGSTDGSSHIVLSYGNRIIPVFAKNAGQPAAFNLGFSRSKGQIIVFLDADDWLLPNALALHANALARPGVVRSQGYLELVDEAGRRTGGRYPSRDPHTRGILDRVLNTGPTAYVSVCTSGNAWSRGLLEQVMPLPPARGIGADAFLMDSAAFFGDTVVSAESVGAYRIHKGSFSDRNPGFTTNAICKTIERFELRSNRVATVAERCGYGSRICDWGARNWRITTLRVLRSRLAGLGCGASLREHVRAVFLTPDIGGLKRTILIGLLVAIRYFPIPISLAIGSHIINLKQM